jgi:SAM-dependent methyltransferase
MTIGCPLCGPTRARPWRRDRGFAVVECLSCGLRLTWPPPTPEQLAHFYAPDDYYEARGMGASAAAEWNERARGILSQIPCCVERALDMGAGQGHLVAALLSLGIGAEGLEPLASGREAALRLHGVRLLESVPASRAGTWDLITLVHVLEHVREPIATLTQLSALLSEAGHVFIDVPHAGSIEYWRPRRRRELLALPGHLFHFTPRSLTCLVERAGLEVVSVRLLNPDALEWLFRLRQQLRSSAAPDNSGAAASPPQGQAAAPGRLGGLRATWGTRLLPWLRSRLPGYRFELVARRRTGPQDRQALGVT